MSEWSGEAFAAATRVPVWTRPRAGAFAAFAAGAAPRFSAWDVDPAAPASAGDREAGPMAGAGDAADRDAAIEAEAFARGFEQGYAAAAQTLADEAAGRDRLAAAIAGLRPAPSGDLAALIAATVARLVEQIVGEVALDPARLAARVATVAALIEEDPGPARLRLHPADVARLEAAGLALPFALVADPALAEGTVVGESAAGWVEDGPAIRMERLRQALDAMAGAR